MKWLIVTMAVIFTSVVAAQPTPKVHYNSSSINPIDQELVMLLQLRDNQIDEYLKIIDKQRKIFLATPDSQWEKQLAIYEETFEKLKPILDKIQFAQFTAYVGCLISEELQLESQVALQ